MLFQVYVALREVNTSVTSPFVTRIFHFKQQEVSYLWRSEVPCIILTKSVCCPSVSTKIENSAALV